MLFRSPASGSRGNGRRLGIREGLSFPVHHYYLRGLDDLLLKEGSVVKRTLARSSGRKSVVLREGIDRKDAGTFPSRHARVAFVLRMLDCMPPISDPYTLSIDRTLLDQLRNDADPQTEEIRHQLLLSVNTIKDVFLESTIREQIKTLQLDLDGDPQRQSFQKRVLKLLRADNRIRHSWPRRLWRHLSAPWSCFGTGG